MHFKLDENLSSDAADKFRAEGHEASTIIEQGLRGSSDTSIAGRCRRDGQVIITLDLGFGDIRDYPPEKYSGIIILRLSRQGHDAILRVIDRVVEKLSSEPLEGKLWIVNESRMRIRD